MRKYVVLLVAVAIALSAVVAVVPAKAAGFSDVPSDYWAYKYITRLADEGIVTGVGGGKYDPEGNLTRAAMAVIAVRLAGINPDKYKNANPTFKDVTDKTKWYYKWVYAALKTGIVKGYPDGTFRPDRNVTRAELIVMAERLYKIVNGVDLEKTVLPEIKKKPYFPALRASDEAKYRKHWAAYYATLAILPQYQLINWREPGRVIALDAPATRAEMAYSIYKVKYPVKIGGTLKIIIEQEPKTLFSLLDSMAAMTQILGGTGYGLLASDYHGNLWADLAYDVPTLENGLLKVGKKDANGNYQPIMTLTMPNGDKKKIYMITEYKLRPGTKWADGAPVTLDDIIFNNLLMLTPGMRTPGTYPNDHIALIEKVDNQTIRFYWTEINPYAPIGAGTGMYPKHWFEKNVLHKTLTFPAKSYFMTKITKDGDYVADQSILISKDITNFMASKAQDIMASSYNDKPLGNGAYEVSRWAKGQSIEEVANRNAWLGRGLFDKVIFSFKSPETAQNELRSKRADVAIMVINAQAARALRKEQTFMRNYNLIDMGSAFWEHWTVNFDDPNNIPDNPTLNTPYNHPLFKYKEVRQALSYALNRKEVIDRVYYGGRMVCHSFIIPGTWPYWSPIDNIVKYDPAKVEPLLLKAGFHKGADGIWVSPEGKKFEFTVITTTRSDRKQSLEIFAQQLKKFGIIMHPETQTARTLFGETIWIRAFDATEFAWGSGSALEQGGRSLYYSSQIPSKSNDYNGQNLSGFRNKDMDAAIDMAFKNVDRKARREGYIKMQQVWAEWLPEIPLSWYDTHDAVIKTLEGFDMKFDVGAHTWNIEYWYKEQ